MHCLQRAFRLIAFHVFFYSQWSTTVSSVYQQSIEFMVIRPGQVPTAGVRQMANFTADSVLECGSLCWNNGNDTGCGGFLYSPSSCDVQSTNCQLLEVSNLSLLSYGPVNLICPQQFYVQNSKGLQVSLTYVIPGNESAFAVASFDNQLFVIRKPIVTNQIAVYDTTNFQLLRNITIPGANGRLYGLTVCPYHNSLYVSDWDTGIVFVVNMSTTVSGNTSITSWPVCSYPAGLSINRVQNVLVTCSSGKVQEYSTNGSFVGERTDTTHLWHSVEVNNGVLVVSRYVNNQVCLMAINGTVLQCYQPAVGGSGPGPMNWPETLAVDTQGFVIVSDFHNDRILVLNPTLSDARLLPLPYGKIGLIIEPMGLWLDVSRGRLYIVEWGGNYRVLVFDNVFNLNAAFTP